MLWLPFNLSNNTEILKILIIEIIKQNYRKYVIFAYNRYKLQKQKRIESEHCVIPQCP